MNVPALLLGLTLRGSMAFLLVEAVDRLSTRFAPGQGYVQRRSAWWAIPLVFLVPFRHIPILSLSSQASILLAVIWAAGFVAVLGLFLVRTVQAWNHWTPRRLCTDSRLLTQLEDAKAELGITAPIGIVVSGDVAAPALFGWLRPRILLPAELAAELPPEHLRAILLHELAHFAAQDLLNNLLFTLVQAVHWFNPFAHLAARSWARFREEAADAAVLYRMDGAAGHIAYGEILLETLRRASASPLPHGALGMGESLRNLKWRLTMIGRYGPHPDRTRWLALLPGLAVLTMILPLPAQSSPVIPDDATAKKEAVAAMLPWLALEDQGNPGAAWDQAAQSFHAGKNTRPYWIDISDKVRPPLGKCLNRAFASAIRQTDPQGAKGDFVVAQFDTSFENMKYTIETVCFEREPDGKWRATGYFIKPKL